jgi:hypothetical protein
MNKIAAAYVKAKRAFGPALKDKTNPAFRSKYADLGACIDAVEDALLDNGIAFIQETSEDATGVTVETVFLHDSGETLRCGKLHVPAAKQDPQGYGSALTYARRYSLMAACGIAPEDDDGNAGTKAVKDAPAKTRTGVAQDVLKDSPALKPEQTASLAKLADAVKEDFSAYGAQAAFERIDEQGLDDIEKIYLSTLLPSNVRNPITAYSRALHAKAVA